MAALGSLDNASITKQRNLISSPPAKKELTQSEHEATPTGKAISKLAAKSEPSEAGTPSIKRSGSSEGLQTASSSGFKRARRAPLSASSPTARFPQEQADVAASHPPARRRVTSLWERCPAEAWGKNMHACLATRCWVASFAPRCMCISHFGPNIATHCVSRFPWPSGPLLFRRCFPPPSVCGSLPPLEASNFDSGRWARCACQVPAQSLRRLQWLMSEVLCAASLWIRGGGHPRLRLLVSRYPSADPLCV